MLKMSYLALVLFCSSCTFLELYRMPEIKKDLIGWWERYYSDESTANRSNITHLEFMVDGEFRYNIGFDFQGSYQTITYNNNKWFIDSISPSDIQIKVPSGIDENFTISVLRINRTNLVLKCYYHQKIDTLFMRRIQ